MTYCTVEDVRLRSDIDRSDLDSFIDQCISAAERKVNSHCGRTFEKSTTATQRQFACKDPNLAYVDDFYSTSGLIVATDSSGDGTTDTTWTTTNYQLEPLNGIVNGNDGFPYWKIRAVRSYTFPTTTLRASLYVTALWGWSAVPDDVQAATAMVAAKLVKMKDTPLGVAGIAASGFEIRIREIPEVVELLSDYVRSRP